MGTRSRVIAAGFVLAALGMLQGELAQARPEDEATPSIAWVSSLPQAFERAGAEGKVVMICINVRHPIGEPDEPAAKGLREIVYLDPRVVARTREFVCVLLTDDDSSADYGEMRVRFGIEGLIVSPQHLFARPGHVAGEAPLVRLAYWRHGHGEEAVVALLALMDQALDAHRVREALPPAPDEATASPEQRAAWIARLVEAAQGQDAALRVQALATLVAHDKEGDATRPLVGRIGALAAAKQTDALVDFVRVLGLPGREDVAQALHDLLGHKDARVRGHVAVTLEYVGSAQSIAPLLARAGRESDEKVANHMYRALGRCAQGEEGVRKKLLREAGPGKKGDFGSFGPLLGLGYFAGDGALARALEKQLVKLGTPFQEGSKAHAFLRAATVWCLAEVRDPATAPFLRKKVMEPLSEEESPWKASVLEFYEAVARRCEGHAEAQATIDRAMERFLWQDGARDLADECRRGRDMSRFVPKGEWGNLPKEE